MGGVPVTAIGLEHVTKSFGTTEVLHDVNLAIDDGEFLVVVGPSGCGKSTLLRLVAGLESPTSGSILLSGRRVNDTAPYQRNVGMVFQNYALYPHMTVSDNLSFGLQARGLPRAEIARQVQEVARMLDIEPLLRAKPGTLSGGQRQRVAVGRALIRRPSVFLMDEPLSNLDALLRDRMRSELRRLHEELRVPTLYVTHDQTEAMTLADRIALLRAGRIQQVGTPKDVYDRPANTFAAQFLGSPPMNLLHVEKTAQGTLQAVGHPHEGVGAPDWVRPAALAASDQAGRLWMGFRPEAAALNGDATGLALALKVETVENLGSRAHVHGIWAGQRITVVAPDAQDFHRGAMVRVRVPWDAVHWFHGDSGERLDVDEAQRMSVSML